MNTISPFSPAVQTPLPPTGLPGAEMLSLGKDERIGQGDETRKTFQAVMGELLFGQMLKSMRKTVGKPAYFHGGPAEEIFTQHLDQVLAKKLAEASAEEFVGPMYELWTLPPTVK